MTRIIVMGIVIAFALGVVGCRSCLAPYDHCQPTFIPERGDQCMGELYRCGSNLGGMQRGSNATGDCESCGGGSVEYFDANGASTVVPQNATITSAIPSAPNPPTTGQYETNSFGNNFVLNDDSGDAY